MPHRAFICRLLFCAIFSVSVVNIITRAASPFFYQRTTTYSPNENPKEFECPQSKLADDVLVVLRTGATESLEKVPVHFRTTLRCVPNYVIISDLDEEIEGHAVHDVLKEVSKATKDDHEDFKLYNYLQKNGRKGLDTQEPITALSGSSKGDYLQTDKEGWRLDKWKFLPMIDRALQEKPDAKWYVFIEDDTYLSFPNLLAYLSQFNPTKPYYIGKHLFINDIEFGYGGAGIVLSAPAAHSIAHKHAQSPTAYETFTASHWVGDCALGKVAEDTHIPLHRAFPHFQGDSPATLDPSTSKIDRDLWCYPAISYHHVSPPEISALWRFERRWHATHDGVLRHRDVFMQHVRPQIAASVPAWDNLSDENEYNAHDHAASADPRERDAWKSFEHCRALCEAQETCLQFSFDTGSCGVSRTFRLGYAKPGERVRSGWMLDRVDELFRGLEEKCGIRDWFAPEDSVEAKMRRKRSV